MANMGLIVQNEQKSGQFMGATIVSTGKHIMVDDTLSHYAAIAFIMYALLVALMVQQHNVVSKFSPYIAVLFLVLFWYGRRTSMQACAPRWISLNTEDYFNGPFDKTRAHGRCFIADRNMENFKLLRPCGKGNTIYFVNLYVHIYVVTVHGFKTFATQF